MLFRSCVRACPTGARHFGDLGDPDSDVSKLVAERGGFDLLGAFGYKPVNKYLPPRERRDARTVATDKTPQKQKIAAPTTAIESLFSWVDRALSR